MCSAPPQWLLWRAGYLWRPIGEVILWDSIVRTVSWTYARLVIQSGLTRLPMVQPSGHCKRHLVHGRPSPRLLHSWGWPHSLPTRDWRPVSVHYSLCLLDIVNRLHKPESTVLIFTFVHERKVTFSLHRKLPRTAHKLILAVVSLTLWAHILSWCLPRRNKSVLINNLIKIRIVGRVYSGTRIKPSMLVHDFDTSFSSDIRGWVLSNFTPQSISLHFFLWSSLKISMLLTISSIEIHSLLLSGKFNRIQI